MAPSVQDTLAYKKALKDCFSLGDPKVYPHDFISDIQDRLSDFPSDLASADSIKLVTSKFIGEPRRSWLSLDLDSRPKTLDDLWTWIHTSDCQDPLSQFHADHDLVTTTTQTTSVAQLIKDVRPAQQRLISNPHAAQHGVNEALIITWFIDSLQDPIRVHLRRQRIRDPKHFTSLALVHQAVILEDSIQHAADYDYRPDISDTCLDYDQDFQDYDHDPQDSDHDSQDTDYPAPDYDSQDPNQAPDQARSDPNLEALISSLVHQQLQNHPAFQAHRPRT